MPLTNEELAKIDPVENLKNRPSKDDYFLALAFVVARKSFDPSSKCGCVIVSKDGRILATGYNGPLPDSNDVEVPLIRPDRYYVMIHGEENALLAYSGSYTDIQGATAYITGRFCHRCLRMLLRKGITRLVYGKNDTACVDKEDLRAQELLLRDRKDVIIVEKTNHEVKKILENAIKELGV